MLAKDIDAYEQNFHRSLNVQVSSDFGFPLAFIQKPTGYYYNEESAKSLIALHYTSGFLQSDIQTLTQANYKVSVPFVVGRNGIVYQLFGSAFWSYHLGPNAVGDNTIQSKRSVAIELSNIGPLTLKGSMLINAYGNPYCSVSETQFYTTLDTPFRGFSHFATFTDAQYLSLSALIKEQCSKWNIPQTFIAEPERYDIFAGNAAAQAYNGIASHVNFRPDKSDIGPAFDWTQIA